jgi:hypothetical protein
MTLARKDRRKRAQELFLMCYEEAGQVLEASRWAKVARSAHYRFWLEVDPTYLAAVPGRTHQGYSGVKG